MKTRDKIIRRFLRSFALSGFTKTSLKTVAKELNMSDGNLRYYFKTKESALEEMFAQYLEEIEKSFSRSEEISFFLFDSCLQKLLASTLKYSFLFDEKFLIINSYPKAAEIYFSIEKRYRSFFSSVLKELLSSDFLTEEYEPFYEILAEHMFFLSESWLSYAKNHTEDDEKEKLEYFSSLILYILVPYLSSSGKKFFWALIQKKGESV